ncbi:MAG: hypothetical protein HOH33_11705 [Verrucomicrobia bacterium]|jgi:uncharacterized protein|nr:hypothetical protein [Verrucomicrobiota bacterium]
MISKVFIDATALEAFLVSDSQWNSWVGQSLKQVKPPLFSCQAVMEVVSTRVQHHPAGLRALKRFLESGTLRMAGSLDEFYPLIFRLMNQFRDIPMTFSEACLTVLCDQVKESRILTVRSEFRTHFHYSDRRKIRLICPDPDVKSPA